LGEFNPQAEPDYSSNNGEQGKRSQLPVTEPRLGGHIPALDAVRGVAILLVTVNRFGHAYGDSPSFGPTVNGLLALGTRGVDLFFVLSGFLITGILFDAKTNPTHYFRNFYMRRTLRIFPLYFGVLFLCFILLPLIWTTSDRPFAAQSRYQLWLWFYGSNFLMSWAKEFEILGGFKHFWSLAVEEHFYLIWPLVIYFTSRQAAMRICVVFIVIAAALRFAFMYWTGNYQAATTLTPCRMDSLAIGALLALAVRGPGGVRAILPAMKWAIIVSGIVLVASIVSNKSFHELVFTVWAVFFGSMIYFSVATPASSVLGRIGHSRILGFFGKYSYGMYVYQNLLFYFLVPWISAEILTQRFGSNSLGRLAYLIGMSIATVVVAYVSWHLYEKQFLKLKVYFEAGHNIRSARGPSSGSEIVKLAN